MELGALAQGDVVALYNYMAQMIIELVKLGSMVITLNKSAACANRIQSILEVKSSMTCPSADGPPSTGRPGTGRGFPSGFLWVCRGCGCRF